MEGKLYSNIHPIMINRYKYISKNITCISPIIDVSHTVLTPIGDQEIRFISMDSLNSIQRLIKWKKIKKELTILIKEHDAVVVHLHSSFISHITANICYRLNKPALHIIVGCPWDGLWNHGIKGKFMAPFAYYNLKKDQKYANYSIYVTKDFLQKRYPTQGQQINCSNVELDITDEEILERRLQRISKFKKGDTLKLATIAALNVPYKGQRYVIEALSHLKGSNFNWEYHLIGGGDDSLLKEQTKKLGIQNQIIFHGSLTHKEVFEFLDHIDVYIQPSKQEGLPRSVIEAMSRGCLCIGSRIAGIPELIENDYLFSPGNVKEIIKIISEIKKEDLVKTAKTNINKSCIYSKNNLDTQRNEFMSKFRDYINRNQL